MLCRTRHFNVPHQSWLSSSDGADRFHIIRHLSSATSSRRSANEHARDSQISGTKRSQHCAIGSSLEYTVTLLLANSNELSQHLPACLPPFIIEPELSGSAVRGSMLGYYHDQI